MNTMGRKHKEAVHKSQQEIKKKATEGKTTERKTKEEKTALVKPRKQHVARRPTVEQFRRAVEGTFGITSLIARRLGVHRTTIYKWINKNKKFIEIIEQERQQLLDVAEAKLVEKIQEGDMRAIEFALRMFGRDRGYMDVQLHAHNHKIVVEIVERQWEELKQKPVNEM